MKTTTYMYLLATFLDCLYILFLNMTKSDFPYFVYQSVCIVVTSKLIRISIKYNIVIMEQYCK